jgi:aryl-alcohol dehydrogenase-like predicted oxidoreductase
VPGARGDASGRSGGVAAANSVVSTTIVEAMTLEELRSGLGALLVQLDDEILEQLDRIWPGPGEAPQAYAW